LGVRIMRVDDEFPMHRCGHGPLSTLRCWQSTAAVPGPGSGGDGGHAGRLWPAVGSPRSVRRVLPEFRSGEAL